MKKNILAPLEVAPLAKLSLEKNILEKKLYSVITYLAPLEKFFLAPLAPLGNAGIQKKIPDSGTTTLIISNKEINDIIKIVQALEDSDILLKGFTETIKKNEQARRGGEGGGGGWGGGGLGTLVGTVGSILLENLLSGKGIVRAGSGRCSLNSCTSYRSKKGKGIVRARYGKEWDSLMLLHPLTNFEIQKYYQNEGWGLCDKP